MKKILRNTKLLILLPVTAVLLPAFWLVAVQLSLPAGESFRIVRETPAVSVVKALQALLIAPALLLLDFFLAAGALFFLYTMLSNIPPLFKKEIEFPWFTRVVLIAALTSSFSWYAIKETPRILFDFTGINVPFHQVIAGNENRIYLVHDILGVRKSFESTSLAAVYGECTRSDSPRGGSYLLDYTFQIGLEIGPTIYLTRENESLEEENPAYFAYHEMRRLARKTNTRLELKKCPQVEEFPPGVYRGEPITGKEPWTPKTSEN